MLSGRLTRITDGSLGGATLEFEGGRVRVELPKGVLSADHARFAQGELATAKRRISAFGAYARQQGLSSKERRSREFDACPTVEVLANFANYSNNIVTFRNGAPLNLSKGKDLPSLQK